MNSMTLDDLERQNKSFMDFLATFGCETHFKSPLRWIHYR